MFADIQAEDTCTDPGCYESKSMAFVKIQLGTHPDAILLAAGHPYGKPKKGTDEWRIAGNKKCPSTKQGVIVQSDSHYVNDTRYGKKTTLGTLLNVCTNKSCKVHPDPYASSYRQPKPSKAELKRREEHKVKEMAKSLVHRGVIQAIAAIAGKKPLPAFVLGDIAQQLQQGTYGDEEQEFLKRHNLKRSPSNKGFAELPFDTLNSCVVDLIATQVSKFDDKALQRYADHYKVDTAKILKTVKDHIKSQTSAKAKEAAKDEKPKAKAAAA